MEEKGKWKKGKWRGKGKEEGGMEWKRKDYKGKGKKGGRVDGGGGGEEEGEKCTGERVVGMEQGKER